MGCATSGQAAGHAKAAFEDDDMAQVCGPPGAQLHRGRGSVSAGPQKLFDTKENKKDKLVAVIVTICEGSSYDEMFSTVQPTTVPGERVSTYAIGCRDVAHLHEHLLGATVRWRSSAWRQLVEDLRAVPTDSVVFNWECCSGCGDQAFPSSVTAGAASCSETMLFLGFVLRSGWTAMFSDFSLKSLLHEWSEEQLGPNPFLQLGECSEEVQLQLEFSGSELQHEEVPQQLQVVGELCADTGKAIVNTMGDTIVYSVNPQRAHTQHYDLKVLTVVTDGVEVTDAVKCSIGENELRRTGAAGHVTLTYKGGGQLVTSNGHWIELTRIDVSLESLERAAVRNFGAAEGAKFQAEYANSATDEERMQCLQMNARKHVQQSVPSRMKGRTKFGTSSM